MHNRCMISNVTVAESDEDVSEVGVASAAARLQAESAGDTKEGVSPAAPMETDGAEAPPEEVEGPKEQRTVFVSNLPSAVTKSQLRERFTEVSWMRTLAINKSFPSLIF